MCAENSGCNCGCGDRTWFPLHSVVQVQQDGSISIQAPTGWYYIGVEQKTKQLKTVTSGNTTVSCTCTGTGGCLPFVASNGHGSTAGCAGSCTACSQKQSAKDVIFDSGGYVNVAGKIEFATTDGMPSAFGAMFQVDEINQAFKSFLDKVYGGLPFPKMIQGENFISAPDGYSLAPVSIFGRVAMVPVPTIALRNAEVGTSGSTTSCSCTQGSCTLHSTTIPLVGSASWCEGSCSGTCTLSNAIIINNVAHIKYTAFSYKY